MTDKTETRKATLIEMSIPLDENGCVSTNVLMYYLQRHKQSKITSVRISKQADFLIIDMSNGIPSL